MRILNITFSLEKKSTLVSHVRCISEVSLHRMSNAHLEYNNSTVSGISVRFATLKKNVRNFFLYLYILLQHSQ